MKAFNSYFKDKLYLNSLYNLNEKLTLCNNLNEKLTLNKQTEVKYKSRDLKIIIKNVKEFINLFLSNKEKIEDAMSKSWEQSKALNQKNHLYDNYNYTWSYFEKDKDMIRTCNKFIKEINLKLESVNHKCEDLQFDDGTTVEGIEFYIGKEDRRWNYKSWGGKQTDKFPNIQYVIKKQNSFNTFLEDEMYLRFYIKLNYKTSIYKDIIDKTDHVIRNIMFEYKNGSFNLNTGKHCSKFLYKDPDDHDIFGENILELINAITNQNLKEIPKEWYENCAIDLSEYLLPENTIEAFINEIDMLDPETTWSGNKTYNKKDPEKMVKEIERIFKLVDGDATIKVLKTIDQSGKTHEGFAPIVLRGGTLNCELSYCNTKFNADVIYSTSSEIQMDDTYDFTHYVSLNVNDVELFSISYKTGYGHHQTIKLNKANIRRTFKNLNK